MKPGFTISEFAKLRDININSLRYYEKIGVLTPAYTDPQTGYRYYTPDQLPVLDVILLCISLDIPLKQLSEFQEENKYILNDKLYETGKEVAKNKIRKIQDELDKIEYTLRYLEVNKQYLNATGLYTRPIIDRTLTTMDYTGDLMDIKRIEQTSAKLYTYAQKNNLSPVFPAGLIISFRDGKMENKVFFEIVRKDLTDAGNTVKISAGNFLCKQINLTPETDLVEVIHAAYKQESNMEIIVSNMLLSKFQIGTKKSELQRAISSDI
ncbi:MAG: MerR family transcriptional regulator [Eubacteriales bacterium]|nr:MerR family transcriptional regulator [Eubacteriales bacterium]